MFGALSNHVNVIRLLAATSLFAILLTAPPVQSSGQVATLPVPLSLEQALSIGSLGHPDLELLQAQTRTAQSRLDSAASNYALQAALDLRAQWIDPSERAFDQSNEDHEAVLSLRKPLYDFGYTSDLVDAGENALDASRIDYQHATGLRQIEITRRFFDVLLADLEFAWRNEAMAMAYVTLDKQRDRHALTQISDIDLLDAENSYQQELSARSASEISQRVSRALLADVINRPGELSPQLVSPRIQLVQGELPGIEQLIENVLASNLELRARQQRVSAARLELNAARNQSNPRLDAELEVARYARTTPSSDELRATLNLHIPLYENGIMQAEVAEQRARLDLEQARYRQLEASLRQQLYGLWQQLLELDNEQRALQTAMQHAQRALDKSRGEYELEMRTDFGDAQVQTSKLRYQLAKNEYDRIIGRMRLAHMAGQEPVSVFLPQGE